MKDQRNKSEKEKIHVRDGLLGSGNEADSATDCFYKGSMNHR